MKRTICFFWLFVALTTALVITGCSGGNGGEQAAVIRSSPEPVEESDSAAAEPAPGSVSEPAAEPVDGPTPKLTTAPTSAPTPEATPLLTEYVFDSGVTAWEQVAAVLQANPALRRLDMRESGVDIREHAATLAALKLEELRFAVDLCGEQITDETEVFTPRTVPEEWDLEVLKLLRGLRRIDLSTVTCEPEQIQMIRESFPEAELSWALDLCGLEVGPDTEALNYNGRQIASLEPFYRTLPLLTKLTSLEMCGCGVENEDMDALRTAFPQAGVVWSIKSRHWNVRTDIDHFATWRIARVDEEGKILEAYNIHGNKDEDVAWLKYCHDIVALDVGHNLLTNCEFVRYMPKLKYLILSDNKIKDLSPLSSLKELIYLEIFVTPVSDLTPLAGLTSLLDLNMCSCHISDLSPLYGLPLERVWMTPYSLKNSKEAAEAFHAAVPNCDLEYIVRTDSTGNGWRTHERYREMRLALGRAKP